jgi:photosystem II stability/assembly factor-like uncharacterized protein
MTVPALLSPNGVERTSGASRPDVLLVATVDGVVELRPNGASWHETARGLAGTHVSSLAFDARERLYAGTHGHGIHRRNATAWEGCSDGLTSDNVYSLGRAGTTLYAGTEPAFLFRRGEGDQRWHELEAVRAIPERDDWNFPSAPHVAHAKHVDVDPRDPHTFYLSIEQGALLKTHDGGSTFRKLPFRDADYVYNSDAHRVAINPRNPDEVYLSGGDGIARSADAGATWQRMATPDMRIGYPDALFCSPLTDGTIYAAGAGARPHSWRASGNADAAIVRSRVRGATWELLPLAAQRGNIEAVTLAQWNGGYGFFVATTDGDVFASDDRGTTWTAIARGLPAISKGGHYETVQRGRAVR